MAITELKLIMTCMERLWASERGGENDVKKHAENFTVSRDGAALVCGMCVLCGDLSVWYRLPTSGRSLHSLCSFELWLRTGAMGGCNEDDTRRYSFPGNTVGRYSSDCRHHIAKDLHPNDLRNNGETGGAYPERVCPVFQ